MSSGNSANEFKKASHTVGINEFHFEFCPKYRYKCMKSPHIRDETTQFILQAAHEHHILVKKIAVLDDHVHMDVFIPFNMSVSRAEMLLKGRSSYLIFRRFPNFRLRYPRGHFWAPGKFSRSMSGVTAEVVGHYIENQQFDKLKQTIEMACEETKQMELTAFL